jgi:hypothetical protein
MENRKWGLASGRRRNGIERKGIGGDGAVHRRLNNHHRSCNTIWGRQEENNRAGNHRSFRMAAGHGAIHGGLTLVVLAGGGKRAVLGVGIGRVFLRRMSVRGAHATSGAASHAALSLVSGRPSGGPKQDHGQQTHTRPPSVARSVGTWTCLPHCRETSEYRTRRKPQGAV